MKTSLSCAALALAAINCPAQEPPSGQPAAIARGTKLATLLRHLSEGVPLTDSTAVLREFRISRISVALRPSHVIVVAIDSAELSAAGLTGLRLMPFRAAPTQSIQGLIKADSSFLSAEIDTSNTCLTVDSLRKIFGERFVINDPAIVAYAPALGASAPVASVPPRNGITGLTYEGLAQADSRVGFVRVNFDNAFCANSFAIAGRFH